LSASWDGFVCPSGRSVQAGARDLLPHMLRMTRSAMQECCYAFLVNSICGPFSKGQQNPEGRRRAIEEDLGTCWIGAFTEDLVKGF